MKKIFLVTLFHFVSVCAFSQVGIGTNKPEGSSLLDLTSTSKGFLPPRMTYFQKTAIIAPAAGLMVWCTDCGSTGELQVYNGRGWVNPNGSPALTRTCGAYTTSGTFLTFACYNLGADTTLDSFTYQGGAINGDLYQWGRPTDGHEKRNSAAIAIQATNNSATLPVEVVGKFIINPDLSITDWRSVKTNNLWGDGTTGANPAKAANDPCPAGFKVPSQAQWGSIFAGGTTYGAQSTATANVWTWTGNGYTVGSNLYLPAAGYRSGSDNQIGGLSTLGCYWSSIITGIEPGLDTNRLSFSYSIIYPHSRGSRGIGYAVRCVAE